MRYSSTRAVAGLLGVLTIALAACGGQADGDSSSGADSSGDGGTGLPPAGSTIKVGSTMDLAPLDFVDEQGEATGFELEVVKAVFEDLGYEIEWVKTPFEQAFTGLQTDRYQMNASAIYMRCARVENTDEYGVFTVPVGQAGQAMTTKTDGPDIAGWEDLEGLKLGVESAGSTADLLADENADAGFEKQIFPDTNALFLALQQGRIDVAMQSEDVTRYTIRDMADLEVAWALEETQLPYGWILREGDPLIDAINASLDKLKEDGTIPAIYEEWFGAPPGEGNPSGTVVPSVTTDTCRG